MHLVPALGQDATAGWAMNFWRFRLPAALALLGIASFVTFMQVKANEETDDPITPSAIWNAENDDLSEIAESCNAERDYGRCFVEQMGNFASSEAVAFSKALLKQSPARVGYLKEMRESGAVDLGVVAYPQAGEPGSGWVLLNGMPAIVNVDDLALLPQSAMEKDPQFIALRKSHPQFHLAVDADQRQAGTMPPTLDLSNGGQRFIIGYLLRDACSSCPAVAQAGFAFDFDAGGQFLGVKFMQISPI